jgi:hypothetical protein
VTGPDPVDDRAEKVGIPADWPSHDRFSLISARFRREQPGLAVCVRLELKLATAQSSDVAGDFVSGHVG